MPLAPKAWPFQTLPSSRTNRQSDFFQGLPSATAETVLIGG
ncbi:hypothetical protein OAD67_03465 [bacterium]|nr:hypothetical protein [bacterium]MDB9925302.1 hypothetical protein [bacterium]